jgi:predicted transcriptional regulator
MLKTILGSENAERVLIFIVARDEGYATEIANFFETSLFGIQSQLERLEAGNILVSRTVGRTRLYMFNPAYPFVNELKNLLTKALDFYPDEVREKLLFNRRRPRRQGKPL